MAKQEKQESTQVRLCSLDGCAGKHFGRGLCQFHYRRWKYQADKERISAKNKQYVQENYETVRARKRAWYEENKAAVTARVRNNYEQNREQRKKKVAEYQKANRAYYNAVTKAYKVGKKRASPTWLNESDRSAVVLFYEAAITLTKETGTRFEVDHIVPLNGDHVCGLHVPWNLQVITAKENREKSNKLVII